MIKLYALEAFRPELKGFIRDIRAVWALEELGAPYERIAMDATKREHKESAFKKINPFGKVPAIEDGDFRLFESSAIIAYLGDKYGAGTLIPRAGTRDRNLYDQWVSFTISTLEPLCWRVFAPDKLMETKDAAAQKQRDDAMKGIGGLLSGLEHVLSGQKYLLGAEFSLADVQLGSVGLIIAHTDAFKEHPRVDAYMKSLYARPAFIAAMASSGEKTK